MNTDYKKQANDFLEKTGTKFSAELTGHDFYFNDDKEKRDIYRITLERNGKKWSFRFGQSLANSMTEQKKRDMEYANNLTDMIKIKKSVKAPTAYDVLAAITKYDPGSFANFCADYGYDEDSRKVEKVYRDVMDEWHNCDNMFHDVIDELSEIA